MTQPENKHQSERKYRAFISYRHASEGKLTKAVDLAMKRIGKPWLKTLLHLPGLRLYRDLSSQGLVGDLEAAVCQAMDESDFFILMASPGSLESPWIPKEVAYWLETRPDESPLIARCAGNLVWDDEVGYDTPETDCLPEELRKHYTGQPLWLDFRESSRSGKPTLKDPEFLRQIALATATVTRRPPEEVIGEEVSRHQRMVRGAVSFSILLLALSAGLAVAWYLASQRLARTQWENGVLYRDVLNRSTEAAFWFASATDSPDRSLADSARLAAWHAVRGAEFVDLEAISDNSQQTDMEQTSDESALNWSYDNIVVQHEGQEPLEIYCDEDILPCDDEDIMGAELSPDGNRVVVWMTDYLVRVLSLSGFEIEGLAGPVQLIDNFEHPGTIEGAIFSPDGLNTLSWDFEGRIFLRNTNARQTKQVFVHQETVNGASFYEDGEQILSWSEDGTLRTWSVDDPISETSMSHGDGVLEARLTADESLVLSRGLDKTVRIWEAHSGLEAVPPLLHDAPVNHMILTDNRHLTTYTEGRRWDWRVRPGAQLAWPKCSEKPVLCGSDVISGARFDTNFERVLSWGSPDLPRVWNANTGQQELELKCSLDSDSERHCRGVEGGLWLDESSRILTWSSDSTLWLWDGTDGSGVAGFPCIEKSGEPEGGCQDAKVDGAQYDSKNNRIVTWDRGNWVRVWSLEEPKELVSQWHQEDVVAANFSPGGKWVASWRAHEEGDTKPTVRLQQVDDKSGNPNESIPLLSSPLEESVGGVIFTSDDERLLAWGSDGGIRLWSQISGEKTEDLSMNHGSRVNGAVFNRNETRVLSWGRNGLVKIWDASSGIEQSSSTCEESKESFCLSVPVGGAMFIQDEEIVAAYGEDDNGTIKFWNADSGEPVLEESLSHGSTIIGFQDVADGKRIVSWGQDGSIFVWDTRTGDQAIPPLSHGKGLKGVLYDENNHRLLSYGGDERLRLWSIDYPAKICKQDLLKKISARTNSEVTSHGEWLSLGSDHEYDATEQLPWWNVRGWFCQ